MCELEREVERVEDLVVVDLEVSEELVGGGAFHVTHRSKLRRVA